MPPTFFLWIYAAYGGRRYERYENRHALPCEGRLHRQQSSYGRIYKTAEGKRLLRCGTEHNRFSGDRPGKIKSISGENEKVARRFLELGLIKGQAIKILNTSILKKVFLVEIRGYILSIKADLLSYILVEKMWNGRDTFSRKSKFWKNHFI